MVRSKGALGIMQLDIPPNNSPGSINSPATYPFPIVCRRVPGAFVTNTVNDAADDKMAAAWIDTAQALIREGAVAISSNCGFSIRYQKAVAQAVSVPVSMSSLLLLPYLLSSVDGLIAVLTFDAKPLTFDLLRLAGVQSPERVVVAGIENTETWKAMCRPANDYTVPQLAKDVIGVITNARKRHPDIEGIVFECAGFPLVAQQVREQTGLPVYDAVTNAKLIMSGVAAAS